MAAAIEGKIGQTHYTNPDADTCYRCPLCARVLNPNGLERHTVRHFLRMHNTPNREYIVTLHEEPWKQVSIPTGGNMARRSGADPPPIAQIQDHAEKADKRRQLGQLDLKRKVLKPKSKPKARVSKKKKRLSGQQNEQKMKGRKGVKRHLKRQMSGKQTKISDKTKAEPMSMEQSDEEPSENDADMIHPDQKRDSQPPMESKKSKRRIDADEEVEAMEGQGQSPLLSPGQEGNIRPRIKDLARVYNPPLDSTTENKEGYGKDVKKGIQTNQPKKRQRTIFEFAGMKSQGQVGKVNPSDKMGNAEDPRGSEPQDPKDAMQLEPQQPHDMMEIINETSQDEKELPHEKVSKKQQ